MMKLKVLALPALLVLALGAPSSSPRSSARYETLIQTTSAWDGTAYQHYPAGQPQISILKLTIPPHTALKWHVHPMPNAAYVLSGDLTIEERGGASKHVVAGQAVAETVGVVHRGVTGNEPAVLIVFYAGAPGLLLSEPARETPKRQPGQTEGH
jgi:quercetin dioxygenase-like cupin family protein